MPETNVLVVGAGIAGLICARELSQSGLTVTILEARNRVGGRIWTARTRVASIPVEFGAEFLHGERVPTWEELRSLRLQTHEVPDRHWKAEQGKLTARDGFWDQLSAVFGQIDPHGPDRDFASFLGSLVHVDVESKQLSRQYVEGFHAADPARIGVQALLRAEDAAERDGMRQFRIHEGYSRLAEELAAGFDAERVRVSLNTVVKQIAWERGKVRMLGQRPEGSVWFEGTRAVVTLPLGVLQQPAERGVAFTPPIGAKQSALQLLAMGKVVKVVLEFRDVFWPERNFGFIHAAKAAIPTWWADERGPVLTGWVGGPGAERLAGCDARSLQAETLRDLAGIFAISQGRLKSLLKGLHWHDWTLDPFSCGAYSYTTAGHVTASDDLARPVENTLFFAGEATAAAGEQGTVHTALLSGRQAARQLMDGCD